MSGQNFVSGGYQGGEREAHIEVRPVRKRVADWLLQRILAPPIPFLGPHALPCGASQVRGQPIVGSSCCS